MKSLLNKVPVFLVIIFASFNVSAQGKQYQMAYTPFPPNFLAKPNENGSLGPSAELVQAIFEKAGLKVKMTATPYARVLAHAKEGKVAFINIGAKANADLVHLPIPPVVIRLYILGKEENPPTTAEGLRGKRVATLRGYKLFNLAPIQEQKETKVSILGNVKAAVNMLQKDRVDYVVSFKGPLDSLGDQIKGYHSKLVFERKGGYLMAIPKSYPNAEKLNMMIEKSFKELVEAGTINPQSMTLTKKIAN